MDETTMGYVAQLNADPPRLEVFHNCTFSNTVPVDAVELAALRKDAERYRWMAPRMFAADFDYGGDGVQALVFEMPAGFRASADCDDTIDAAMSAAPAVGAA